MGDRASPTTSPMGQPTLSRDSFDAALIPGIRERLAEAYKSLRRSESDVFAAVLDESGEFRAGIAHVRDCPLCGLSSDGAAILYRVHGMHIVECTRCRLAYSRHVINREADDSRYKNSGAMEALMELHGHPAYAALEGDKARYIVGRLLESRSIVGRLLDIGCSTGAILAAAAERGWPAQGIDLNGTGVRFARARGFDAVEGSFPADLPHSEGEFAAITMLDILEHAEHPVAFLESVAERLAPGGVVGIQVPNFNSLLIQIEGQRNNNICHGHWSYFTADTLAKVADRCGLTTEFVETIISEADRILAYPAQQVLVAARHLVGGDVSLPTIDHRWIHRHRLGYKLFGVFRKPAR